MIPVPCRSTSGEGVEEDSASANVSMNFGMPSCWWSHVVGPLPVRPTRPNSGVGVGCAPVFPTRSNSGVGMYTWLVGSGGSGSSGRVWVTRGHSGWELAMVGQGLKCGGVVGLGRWCGRCGGGGLPTLGPECPLRGWVRG